MVIGAFPVGKVLILGIKQITGPVSAVVKTIAKHNTLFRKCLCAPAGQIIHWAEIRSKLYVLKLSQPKRIPSLRENLATDLGANLIGELFVVSIGLSLIYFEIARQAVKDKKKHETHVHSRMKLKKKISTLKNLVEYQDEELNKLHLQLIESSNIAD